jgi:hypothetical protein
MLGEAIEELSYPVLGDAVRRATERFTQEPFTFKTPRTSANYLNL